MKRILSVLLFVLFIISACNHKKITTIGIVQIANDEVLDIARENLIQELSDNGYQDGKNIKIDYKNAQGEISNLYLILKDFQSKKVDLIITNGTPSMSAAAQAVKDIPIVFMVAFSPQQIGISKPPTNLCGVYDPLDMSSFLDCVLEFNPNIKSIGMPFNTSEPNAQYAAKLMKEECAKRNIALKLSPLTNTNDIQPLMKSLINMNVQAIVVAADNVVYSTLPYVANACNQAKIPLLVSDPNQCSKGATIGYGASYSNWGRESGKLAVEILKGKKPSELGIIKLSQLEIIINNKSAKSAGISIPQSLINKASKVIN